MKKRTDIHRPSAIIPEDYEFVAAMTRADSLEGAIQLEGERQRLRAHREATGGRYSDHDHGGSCHVCGASFIDYAIFHHAPTNTYIHTGFDCAEKLGGGDPEAFKAIRDERRALEKAKAGKMKARAQLKERGLLERVEAIFDTGLGNVVHAEGHPDHFEGLDRDLQERGEAEEWTIADMVRKLIRYGSLSEKQWGYMRSLFEKLDRLPEFQAKRDEERAKAEPAPEGRMVVTGKVATLKTQESQWGAQVKMLLLEDRGFKVWTTVPRGLDVERGDRVQLTVTLDPKADDPSFAIGRRPCKGSVLEEAAA